MHNKSTNLVRIGFQEQLLTYFSQAFDHLREELNALLWDGDLHIGNGENALDFDWECALGKRFFGELREVERIGPFQHSFFNIVPRLMIS